MACSAPNHKRLIRPEGARHDTTPSNPIACRAVAHRMRRPDFQRLEQCIEFFQLQQYFLQFQQFFFEQFQQFIEQLQQFIERLQQFLEQFEQRRHGPV